jgi:DNA polymerase
MIIVGLDFETRSRVDLKACGTDVYASDPSTDILMCSFINKDNGQQWLWYAGEEVPADLRLALNLAVEVEAHNARFDQLIYEYIAVPDYGFPALKKEKWVCTAAQCRVNALPASLDAATRAADATHKKDHTGSALIRKLCMPDKKTGEFNSDPALLEKMGAYCLQDSKAMVGLTRSLRELSAADKRDWQTNERINDRGVRVDIELATLAQKYAADEKEALGQRLSDLTKGHITAVTQTAKYLKALRFMFETQGRADLMALITKVAADPTAPVKYTLDKAARAQLLACEDLHPEVHEVIDLIDQGGKSSVAKFTSMINRADPDTDRVHGAFIFAGAGQTQRYSSKGLQLHNMKRECFNAAETEALKHRMRVGEPVPDVMNTLAKLLRPTIIPAKGHKFVVGDWSAIEARVLPWLSDSTGGDAALDVFRRGEDVYVKTAEAMGLDDRQIGKVANLSLGFGGSVGAFQAMAKNYGLTLEDNAVQLVVKKWRKANKWAVKFWSDLEAATTSAVRSPEKVYTAGRVRYVYVPQLLGGTLMCILPNDTLIQYPYAKIEKGGVTAMKASVQPKADSDDPWPRMSLWGGFLAENITQATAACLLRELLADMVADDFPVVGHVHDEVILEALDCEVEQTLADCQAYMETVPAWAEGLPLKAVPEVFDRYGK